MRPRLRRERCPCFKMLRVQGFRGLGLWGSRCLGLGLFCHILALIVKAQFYWARQRSSTFVPNETLSPCAVILRHKTRNREQTSLHVIEPLCSSGVLDSRNTPNETETDFKDPGLLHGGPTKSCHPRIDFCCLFATEFQLAATCKGKENTPQKLEAWMCESCPGWVVFVAEAPECQTPTCRCRKCAVES